jgi:hypothetical protein
MGEGQAIERSKAMIFHGWLVGPELHRLGVLGDGHVSHTPLPQCRSARQIPHDAGVNRAGNGNVVNRHIAHQRLGIHRLHEVGAAKIVKGAPGNGKHRCGVHFRIVEPVHQMHGAWAGGCHADPELARVLRIPGGHEGGGFFVAYRDEANLILSLAQRLDDRVDAIADDAEDELNVPSEQRLDENVRGVEFRVGRGDGMGVRRARCRCRLSDRGEARPHQPHAKRTGRLQNAAAGMECIEFVSDGGSFLTLRPLWPFIFLRTDAPGFAAISRPERRPCQLWERQAEFQMASRLV